MFEVPAGGRRYRALELLVKQKRMAKNQLVPCVVRTEGLAEEDSLAENSQREALHPLDQFRAFQALRDKGLGEEDIAARFFVTPAIVKQRLKLAAVSPRLLDLYEADEMTLDQLMAFTVSGDHARQEIVHRLGRVPPEAQVELFVDAAVDVRQLDAQVIDGRLQRHARTVRQTRRDARP